jgi:hypothetical protein
MFRQTLSKQPGRRDRPGKRMRRVWPRTQAHYEQTNRPYYRVVVHGPVVFNRATRGGGVGLRQHPQPQARDWQLLFFPS